MLVGTPIGFSPIGTASSLGAALRSPGRVGPHPPSLPTHPTAFSMKQTVNGRCGNRLVPVSANP